MFGERPLTLIRIGGEEAEAALLRTSLNTADEALLARVESELEKLVR